VKTCNTCVPTGEGGDYSFPSTVEIILVLNIAAPEKLYP